MERLDIYYINLDHRTDKRQEIEGELAKMGVKGTRFPAIRADPGCLGCSLSHTALLTSLQGKKGPFLILEDDFTLHDNLTQIQTSITKLWEMEFDVVMFASNTLQSRPFNGFLVQCVEANTTAGYLVSAKFLPVLLQNFKEGVICLKENLRLGQPPYSAIDQYWKRLQRDPGVKWYICEPAIGYQRAQISDVSGGWTDPQKRY